MSTSSTQGIKTVLHPVSDLAAAKPVYAALLGTEPQADSDYYVGFDVEGQHIGLVPGGGRQGMTSPVAYWHVADIEAKLAEVTAAGATLKEPVPEVDLLEGLTTAIIVDQERMGANPRSTVGTVTDANAILRVLFSRLGQPHIGPPTAFSFNVPARKASGVMTSATGEKTV